MNEAVLDADLSRAILSCLPMGALLTDEHGVITWVNDAFCQMLDAGKEDIVGATVASVLGEATNEVPGHGQHYSVRGAGGERLWLQCTTKTLSDSDGGRHVLCCFSDITAFDTRRKGRAAVVSGIEPSRVDQETGVLNRRAVLQELSSQISRSRRYGNALSAILVRFSDAGDLARGEVREGATRVFVAQAVKEDLRWVDSVGSIAPGELLVVLPETDEEATARVSGKIEEALERGRSDGHDTLEFCVGLAGWSRGHDVQTMIERLERNADDRPQPA